MADLIELPDEEFDERRTVEIRFRTQAFPNQTFRGRYEWNVSRKNYVWTLEHIERNVIITQSVVTPYRLYRYADYVEFYFLDPAFEEDVVTPEVLGDTIYLYANPRENGQPISDWDDKPDWYSETLEFAGEI